MTRHESLLRQAANWWLLDQGVTCGFEAFYSELERRRIAANITETMTIYHPIALQLIAELKANGGGNAGGFLPEMRNACRVGSAEAG